MQALELIIQLLKVITWPAVAIYAIWVFKPELKKSLGRLQRVKIGQNEAEFRDGVKELNETVEIAKEEASQTTFSMEENKKKSIQLNHDKSEILEAAEVNPELGIMKLSSILEREVRNLAVHFLGQQNPNLKRPFLKLCKILIGENYLPPHIAQSLKIFWELRNKIVHGTISKDDEDVIRVLDIGLNLLETIQSISIVQL